jgi:hypothetical protein
MGVHESRQHQRLGAAQRPAKPETDEPGHLPAAGSLVKELL